MGWDSVKQGLVGFEPDVVDCVKSAGIPHHIFGRIFQPRVYSKTFQTAPGEWISMASGTTIDRHFVWSDNKENYVNKRAYYLSAQLLLQHIVLFFHLRMAKCQAAAIIKLIG